MTFTNQQKLAFMRDFTKAYDGTTNIYEREARCNDQQLRCLMMPLRGGDLIAGRQAILPIGFLPQSAYDSVGYYCDEPSLHEMKLDSTLSPEEIRDIDALLAYWKGKTTKEKIKARYSKDQLERLSHGNYHTEAGIAFPLYRMSGAQMDPTKLLEQGIDGLIANMEKNREKNPLFMNAATAALVSLSELCLRYRDEASALAIECAEPLRAQQLAEIAGNLDWIATRPPRTFWQAMQLSYLFYLVSGTFNYGRMDEYLGGYLAGDLDTGLISEEFALDLTKNLWALIIERKKTWDSRVILGGADRRNIAEADRFAMLAMEASRQLRDVLPQLTLRCYDGMDSRLYDKALEVIGDGTTYPMLYNDNVNIPSVMSAFAVDEETAADYVPFGCGEYVIYNKSFGTPSGTINLLHGLNTVILEDHLLENSSDFDSFYTAYLKKMSEIVLLLAQQEKLEYDVCAEDAPYLYFSILFDDCLECGKPVFDGGIRYLGGTLESYGNTNTSDSLTAIKTLVYEQKQISPAQLAEALRQNFSGCDDLRRKLLAAPKFGNDDYIADSMAVRLHDDICGIIRDCGEKVGLHSYLMVMINNSMNATFGLATGASADGRLGGTYMANANNPTGGMDQNGVTAMLNSLVKLKTDQHAGAVQNMRFTKEMFTRLLPKTKGLLSSYFSSGGAQAMITVLGRGDLENALREPQNYRNLIVRVGGFSARFVELAPEVQQELLSRTLY